MKLGVLTWNEYGWCPSQLKNALAKHGVEHFCFSFKELAARIKLSPAVTAGPVNVLDELDGVLVRPVGRGSLEEIIFRLDLLHKLERMRKYVVNPPSAIEHSVDKFHALALLEEDGVPVPPTAATENYDHALEAFNELEADVVVKPIFGSRGVGSTRVTDVDTAARIFKAILFYHGVIYLQQFVPHGSSDIRAFVVGDSVAAAMRRVADTWKTNVSQGAEPVRIRLSSQHEKLAVKASKALGCRIAGVDMLDTQLGPLVVEVNSQPGWRGLQSVADVNIAEEIVKFVLSELDGRSARD